MKLITQIYLHVTVLFDKQTYLNFDWTKRANRCAMYISCANILLSFNHDTLDNSQRTLTVFVGVVALRHQHHLTRDVDNGVPQLP